jgi:hypothetical protein
MIAENLPGPSPNHMTPLHQIWDHFVKPLFLRNFPKILVTEDICEGSTILDYSNSMKILQDLHMTKSSCYTKF